MFGGYDGASRTNDLHILNLEEVQWEHVHMKDGAPGRQRHSMPSWVTKALHFWWI